MRPFALALTVLTSVWYPMKHSVTNRSVDAAGRQPPPLPTVSVGTEHGCGLVRCRPRVLLGLEPPWAARRRPDRVRCGERLECRRCGDGRIVHRDQCWRQSHVRAHPPWRGVLLGAESHRRARAGAGRERVRRIPVQSSSGSGGDQRSLRYGLRGLWPHVCPQPRARVLLGTKRPRSARDRACRRQLRRRPVQRQPAQRCGREWVHVDLGRWGPHVRHGQRHRVLLGFESVRATRRLPIGEQQQSPVAGSES
jgi:hypothetical protein